MFFRLPKLTRFFQTAVLGIFFSFSLFGGISGLANNGGANNNAGGGLSAFQIFNFNCIFPVDGCPAEDALLGSVRDALLSLAPILATIVFIWGGYQYFLGGLTGKQNGLNAIKSAVIGLVLVFSADFIINTFLQDTINNGTIDATPFNTLLVALRDVLLQLALAAAVIVIIYGGYQYMFTGIGGKENGRKTIINGVIGLAVILSATAITAFVQSFLVISDFNSIVANTNSLGGRIADIIVAVTNNILIPVAAAVTVFFVILAGYKWVSSPSVVRAGEAREALINALIGFIVVLAAITIVQLIYFFTLSGFGGVL